MADWPLGLSDLPNRQGFNQQAVDSVLRSPMGYGPDKLRNRNTANMENVVTTVWANFSELALIRQFYKDNKALEWNWSYFLNDPPTPAIYRFRSPPRYIPLGGQWWIVQLQLETQEP